MWSTLISKFLIQIHYKLNWCTSSFFDIFGRRFHFSNWIKLLLWTRRSTKMDTLFDMFDSELFRTVQNCSELFRTVQNCSKLFRTILSYVCIIIYIIYSRNRWQCVSLYEFVIHFVAYTTERYIQMDYTHVAFKHTHTKVSNAKAYFLDCPAFIQANRFNFWWWFSVCSK